MSDYFSYDTTFVGSGTLHGTTFAGSITWEVISGTFTKTTSGTVTISESGNNTPPPIAVVNLATPDVQLQFDTQVSNGGDSTYFRVVDANNWWRVTSGRESDGTNFIKVQKCVSGVVTTVHTALNYEWNTIWMGVRGNKFSMTPGISGLEDYITLTSEHATATKHGIGRGTSYYQTSKISSFWTRGVQPRKPDILTPSLNTQTFTSSYPTFSAEYTGGWSWDDELGLQGRIHYQIATDLGFTNIIADEYGGSRSVTFSHTTSTAVTTRLPQVSSPTPLYTRARIELVQYLTDIASDWSAVRVFYVVHIVGTLNHTPKNGQGITPDSPFLSWAFSDSDTTCSQTAYQIVIENNINGQVIIDTGKVASSQDYYEIPDALNLSQTYTGLLRWKVKVWDLDDKPSNFSSYNSFYLVAAPSVNVIQPAPNEVDYPHATPTFVWSIGPSGRAQVGYGIEVYESVGGALGTTVYTTGYISSTSNIHTVTQPILETGKVYIVIVTVFDNYGLSAESQNEFSVTYTPTPKPEAEVTDEFYLSHGYILVSWVAYEIDPNFLAWRVYRRELGTAAWTRIAEISQSTVGEYHDYLVPAQTTQEYYVTQVADRFGTPFESVVSSADIMRIDIPAGGYWLIDPLDSTNNQLLHNVTDDPYTIEYEQVSFNIIGRGRHTDIGNEIGVSGTITAQLRNSGGTSARTKKKSLEALKRLRKPMRLRNPFGDIYHVSLGQLSIDRVAGVGADEFVDVTIPYEENYEE